ncbi:MAG: glycosyltransferase [Acidimicrobiia bacterium]|nr:glycosyltransferase [Acidimicrobiia bacterium]
MRTLFLHQNFPAQFRHLAAHLARRPGAEVVFGTAKADGSYAIEGVRRAHFEPARQPRPLGHPYLRSTERAVLTGQAVARMCAALRARGFTPDVVVAHSGWGPALYVKEVFPQAKLLLHLEWYFRSRGADIGFLPADLEPSDDDRRLRAVTGNVPFLYDLAEADWAWTPTAFQRAQLPELHRRRVTVLHEGIDTSYFTPGPDGESLGRPGLDLPGLRLAPGTELVTYATRGMEPYRGFPQFMQAAALLAEARPQLHVAIAGEDRVVYGTPLGPGDSWRARLLAELGEQLDPARVHFLGGLPYIHYRELLRASSAHVYLTVPFVLSWGMLEAMACGVRLVASETAPVQEVVRHGENGLLVDFFDHEALAARVQDVLDHPGPAADLGAAARRTIVERYDLASLLPRQEALVRSVAEGLLAPG